VRPYVVRPATARDIAQAYAWYERQRAGLGEDFLAELQFTIDLILTNPLGFPAVFKTTRRALVHRFPYGIFFNIIDETVVFVACFHTRRSPSVVKRRR